MPDGRILYGDNQSREVSADISELSERLAGISEYIARSCRDDVEEEETAEDEAEEESEEEATEEETEETEEQEEEAEEKPEEAVKEEPKKEETEEETEEESVEEDTKEEKTEEEETAEETIEEEVRPEESPTEEAKPPRRKFNIDRKKYKKPKDNIKKKPIDDFSVFDETSPRYPDFIRGAPPRSELRKLVAEGKPRTLKDCGR